MGCCDVLNADVSHRCLHGTSKAGNLATTLLSFNSTLKQHTSKNHRNTHEM